MAKLSADQFAEKWAANLSRSTDAIRQGVESVQVSPGQQAARAADLWVQRTQAAKDKFRANVSRVDLGSWQQAVINKGIPRVSSGAEAAKGKMAAFASQFLPYVESGAARVRQMPKGSLEASIARARAMIEHNAAFKRGGNA